MIEKLGLAASASESPASDNELKYTIERLNAHEWQSVLDSITDTVAVVCQPGLHAIAFYYQDILKERAALQGMEIGRIIKSPIIGLVEYYKEKFNK